MRKIFGWFSIVLSFLILLWDALSGWINGYIWISASIILAILGIFLLTE